MTTTGWLPAPVEDLFGPEATAEESYEVLTVDVPPASWLAALEAARDGLGCTYFDWLSAVDEPGTGFRVAAHVAALSPVRRLLVRTTVPHEAPTLPSAVGVYAGAGWHERETHEMFGVDFTDHPALDHLLLPENFEGHPLRKDFVLAARVAKAWPGAKEPGESEHGGPKRRQMLPPGVPDPNEWGPLKGQLPPAPARPARGAGRAAGAAGERPARAAGERPARAAGERPVRRARTSAEGSASQAAPEAGAAEGSAPASAPARPARTAAEGPASQTAPAAGAPEGTAAPSGPRRSRSASQGSASQRSAPEAAPETTAPDRSAPEPAESGAPAAADSAPDTAASETATPKTSRSSDAPWHHARPAFDEPERERPSESESDSESEPEPRSQPESEPDPESDPADSNDSADRNDSAGGPQ
ncbi:NADH-quinone oxidoreductase subunit C [Streptomyces chartreusis]|uniref:NADH-quinone oxidoreductase subunit C n=1 Tax=Streptomyces chartreusis TaxID=1969 RepID=UPI00123D1CDF|nr:NADH-quinone oxidoreductase subunit C [Streptomyces chartreusis]QEV68358.1 NADH-quinone oxidoreductase subunit C [Streptomyces chartreusis]GGX35267.1 dehydrogenase [Streptomyces chartreusis]